jgi:hypothetical protein
MSALYKETDGGLYPYVATDPDAASYGGGKSARSFERGRLHHLTVITNDPTERLVGVLAIQTDGAGVGARDAWEGMPLFGEPPLFGRECHGLG